MKKTSRIVSLAGLLLLGSAGIAMALPAAAFQGRPAFKAGKAYGAFVWHSAKGHQVRFTTKGKPHVFQGKVCAPGGIAKWNPVRKDYGDKVRLGKKGKCIHFHFKTAGGMDGFTFRAPKGKVITYDFKKGTRKAMAPAAVHIGKSSAKPKQVPFILNRK